MSKRFQIPNYLNISSDSLLTSSFQLAFVASSVNLVREFYRRHLKNIRFFRCGIDFILRKINRLTKLVFIWLYSQNMRKRYSIIRFQDYVIANGSLASLLVPACSAQTLPPKVFPAQDSVLVEPTLSAYEFSSIQVAVIKNATAIGGTNLIFVDHAVICHDMYDFEVDSTSEELHNRCLIDSSRNEILWFKKIHCVNKISTAAVFLDACAHNYAHWLTEVLPRIAAFCKEDCYKDIPIIVDQGLHTNQMESLGPIVGINRKLYTLDRDEALQVESLFLVSASGYVPFGVRSPKKSMPSHGSFSPIALTQMRDVILAEMSQLPKRQWPKKILLTRKSLNRSLLNENQLALNLFDLGFELINTAELTFLEQVQLFSESREIIAATGAAVANAIFAPPGAKISVIMSKHNDMIYKYWLNMLSPLGIDLTYILGEIYSNQHLGIHADYMVSDECLIEFFSDKRKGSKGTEMIHPTAIISVGAKLGNDVQIGAFTIVHENVILGDRVKIGSYCELGVKTSLGDGSPLVIGDDAQIRSHSIFYESSLFGDGLVTGHQVIVREKTVAGKSFQIGTASEIQGDCTIGDYVRFQSNIFVGKTVKIGNFVRIAPYVVLTNDPTPPSEVLMGCVIDDFASISAASTILPGVKVGKHALVAAQSCVTNDVPEGAFVAGIPARVLGNASDIKLRDGSGRPAYPWTKHFKRSFPDEVIKEWDGLHGGVGK